MFYSLMFVTVLRNRCRRLVGTWESTCGGHLFSKFVIIIMKVHGQCKIRTAKSTGCTCTMHDVFPELNTCSVIEKGLLIQLCHIMHMHRFSAEDCTDKEGLPNFSPHGDFSLHPELQVK